ncbi:MAG: M12 family metallopeptidase [Geminicoccaceae bacterium]
MLNIVVGTDEIRLGERLAISFHRTLRLPEDGKSYPLPPGLGRLPIARANLSEMLGHEPEALVIPLHCREAMWIGFAAAPWKPNAVKVVLGGINAVTGVPDEPGLHRPQDYLVCPDQLWLDGFNAGGGAIRQFVAVRLGQGYAAEGGHGLSERGGLRLNAFEPLPGRFPEEPPPNLTGLRCSLRPRGVAEVAPMGIGAGGRMRQKLYPDPYGLETWDQANSGVIEVVIVDAGSFAALTGLQPPDMPIDAATYTAHGLPWFELDDAAQDAVAPAAGGRLRTVAERDAQLGCGTGIEPGLGLADPQVTILPSRQGSAAASLVSGVRPVPESGAGQDPPPSAFRPMTTSKRETAEVSDYAPAPKICFDRILPRDLNRPLGVVGSSLEAIVEFRKLWPNGSRLRVLFMQGTHTQQDLAMEQAAWWTEHANIEFMRSEAPDSEIRVTFDASDGAWSFVGTDCRDIPQGQATMNLGFQDGGTSGHEFGHALGLAHEHQNPAGGIQWNEPEVIRSLKGPPNFWTEAQIRHNVLNKYSSGQIRGTAFDSDSIMLYEFPVNWTLNGVGTHGNEELSATDKSFIAQCYPPGSVNIVTLGVDAVAAAARIGAPAEEDLFEFVVDHDARYVVETGGQTDVVMKLFGPNSPTSLIGEDDDSGTGFNARLAQQLVPGHYLVQIRHFNRHGGTGDYTIRVTS